jgi:hypothetical protein
MKTTFSVIPVKTGIQETYYLDSRLRGSYGDEDLLPEHQSFYI